MRARVVLIFIGLISVVSVLPASAQTNVAPPLDGYSFQKTHCTRANRANCKQSTKVNLSTGAFNISSLSYGPREGCGVGFGFQARRLPPTNDMCRWPGEWVWVGVHASGILADPAGALTFTVSMPNARAVLVGGAQGDGSYIDLEYVARAGGCTKTAVQNVLEVTPVNSVVSAELPNATVSPELIQTLRVTCPNGNPIAAGAISVEIYAVLVVNGSTTNATYGLFQTDGTTITATPS